MSITPNTTGLPGITELESIVGALLTVGLIASVAGLVLSAIVWAVASHSGNVHIVGRAKTGVVVSAVAAMLTGGAVAHHLLFHRRGLAVSPRSGRAAVIATSLGVLVLATALVVSAVALPGPGGAHPGDVVQPRATLSSQPAPTGQPSPLHRHTPATAFPGNGPAQKTMTSCSPGASRRHRGCRRSSPSGGRALPSPGGWPVLPVAATPQAWVAEFVPALVDVDFAQRSRSALAACPGRGGARTAARHARRCR